MNKIILLLLISFQSSLFSQQLTLAASESNASRTKEIIEKLVDVFESSGYEITINYLPSKRSIMLMNEGNIDGDLIRVANYDDLVGDSIRIEPAIVVARLYAIVSVHSNINTVQELQNKSLAIIRGIIIGETIASTYNIQDIHEFNSTEAMFGFIARGRADFTIFGLESANQIISDLHLSHQLKILQEPILEIPYYLWLHAKHENISKDLSTILQRAIESGDFVVKEY
jgi:polar amino acid transport system substrate-binding protein